MSRKSDNSDRMSSVSNSSKFSVKSQQVIAEQDAQIAMMRRMLVGAGIDPDVPPSGALPPGGQVLETMEIDTATNSKKRLPSGSPVGKNWDRSGSESGSCGDAIDAMEEDINTDQWRLTQLRVKKEDKKMSKKEAKKARRLEKAKENRKVSDAKAVKTQTLTQAQAQVQVPAQAQAPAPPLSHEENIGNKKVTQAQDQAQVPPIEVASSPIRRLFSSIVVNSVASSQSTSKQASMQVTALTPVFRTPAPDGPFRDKIIVEILSMDKKEFKGTITPTEARKTIFEDVLGFKQDDLAGVKIGYNYGRIVTFKLKQQFDVDDLFEWENFSFERRVGREVSRIDCLIRGLRDPSKRKENRSVFVRSAQAQTQNQQYSDDGTRVVKISGCDYKLLESEILDWLALFGEVLSEITEEQYEDLDDTESRELPPVGNGNYLVTMRLEKDLPNWIPIYGRRICLDYKGNKKQCNWCYGSHLRKYCKNEKMSLEEYAVRFRVKNPNIPEQYYGKLAKIENIEGSDIAAVAAVAAASTAAVIPLESQTRESTTTDKAVPKLTLRRESIPGATWVKVTPVSAVITEATATIPQPKEKNDLDEERPAPILAATRSATGNAVSSMLNVIRATFKQPERVSAANPDENPAQSTTVRGSSATRGRGLSRAGNC